MIKLGLLLSVSIIALASCASSQQTEGNAKPGDIPFDVVYLADSRIVCSGIIISAIHALTAAHCIPVKYKQSSVYAGHNELRGSIANGVRKHVVKTLVHEQYNGVQGKSDNDIALLFLNPEKPFVFNQFIQPAVLPSEDEDYQQMTTTAFVASWGENRLLKRSLVRLISRDSCISVIGDIGKNVICANYVNQNTDACKDTSGGALFINKKVFGLASFGWTCGLTNRPSGYVDIAKVRKWIHRNSNV